MNVAVVITVITGTVLLRYDDGGNIVFVLTINDRIIN